MLTQCRKSYFKKQHIDIVLLLDIINEEEKYEVKEIRNYRK